MSSILPAIESAFPHPEKPVVDNEDLDNRVAGYLKHDQHHKHDKDPFSYRHYVTLHPTHNKILEKRWDERTRDLHLRRLREARPSIDNSPPKVYPHLELRLKRMKLEEERLCDIRRKNHILLDRIAFQMIHAAVDNTADNERRLKRMTRERAIHIEERKRRNALINTQNTIIFQRIEKKSPNYNRYEWMADHQKNVGYLKNISLFPAAYYGLSEKTFKIPSKSKEKKPEIENKKIKKKTIAQTIQETPKVAKTKSKKKSNEKIATEQKSSAKFSNAQESVKPQESLTNPQVKNPSVKDNDSILAKSDPQIDAQEALEKDKITTEKAENEIPAETVELKDESTQ